MNDEPHTSVERQRPTSLLRSWLWLAGGLVVGMPLVDVMPLTTALSVLVLGVTGSVLWHTPPYKQAGVRCIAVMIGLSVPTLAYFSLAIAER